MNYQLIVAEKPSVAMAIAKVLGATTRRDGYVEGTGHLVSWCYGHLTELSSPAAYDERLGVWRKEDLPIVPTYWKYTVPKDKKPQFQALARLMHRADVTEVVNACDAGREGELIFRNLYQQAECKKPILRLWLSSLEDDAIREGMANLLPGEDFEHLAQAARCRQWADWLVGINASRLFSLEYHRSLNVGRVVSPTLALLVQREAEIGAFTPEPYYTASLNLGDCIAVSEKYKDRAETEAACNAKRVQVVSVVTEEKQERPPALYDLTTLQRDANRELGYTAQETLDYLQELYEKKLCTYPRTDCRYLTDDMEATAKAAVLCAAGICGIDPPRVENDRQVLNSKKVTDHHALLPTMAAGEADIAGLPKGERNLLKLLCKQVLRAVSAPFCWQETVIQFRSGDFIYSAKGKTILDEGWKAYTDRKKEDKLLPVLAEGQVLEVLASKVKEDMTKPPARYTEDTLLSAMESAGSKEAPEDAERKGLGTPATRAGMIEKLVQTGLVGRAKAKKAMNLVPCPKGVSLITVLPEQLQSPLLTAEWEHKLKEVERGELDPDDFMTGIAGMMRELVANYKAVPDGDVLFPSGKEVLGKCPRCGGDVTESKKGYFCERSSCSFGLWRDNHFLTERRIELNANMVRTLLAKGKVHVVGIYSLKTQKLYDADLVLRDKGDKISYSFDFGGKRE